MNLNNDAKTYLDIFKEHYPNFIFKEFYGNYCPAGFFKYGMDMHHPDCSADCDKCWSCTADSEWCESGDYEIPEYWKGISAPTQGEAAVFDMQTAEQTADVFNYAVLSAEMGDYLKRKEEQLKNEYMNFTANCGRIFAEAQEKLAKNGFGDDNGLFRKWIASMGFSKTTVYRMIDIYKFRLSQIGTDEGKTFFDALPKTLQADISAPSAPPELVDKVMSGDITTHKKYIALKKQLESQKQNYSKVLEENQELRRDRINAMNRANNAERELSDAKAEIEKLNREADEADREYDAMADRECHYETEICELKHQIKELESQPRDVAVQADPEQERKFSETLRRLNLDFENYREEADRDLADMRNQRNAALDRAEAAEARLSTPKAESNIKPFLIKMTMDDFSALINALENEPYLKKIIQKAQVIRL